MLPPAKLSPSYFHASFLSTLVRTSRLAPSSRAPPNLFPRFTPHPHPHSSGFTPHPHSSSTFVSLLPAELSPSYFHTSHYSSTLHIPSTLVRRFHLAASPSCCLQQSSPQAISTLHIPSMHVRHSRLAPSTAASPKLLPHFTSHPRSSNTPVQQATCTLHIPSAVVRHSHVAPSREAPPNPSTLVRHSGLAPSSKLLPRFTSHPRSSGTPISNASHISRLVRHSGLAPSSRAPPKLFIRFTSHHPITIRPALSGLAPSSGAPPNLFLRFTSIPSTGTPVSLLPAELPPSCCFHASHPSTLVRHSRLAPSCEPPWMTGPACI